MFKLFHITNMLKTNVIWPRSRRFQSHSEWEPVGFFSEGLCNASTFDLKLGFFSSSAINVLCDGFAYFIYNGGRMRLIINDLLSEQDKRSVNEGLSGKPLPAFNLNDIGALKNTLSARDKHFFNCLAYLIRHDRIAIKIIAPKGNTGIAHTKCGLFGDGINRVAFDGSCNFSRTALLDNIESITAFCDWDGGNDIFKINDIGEDFIRTFDEKDENVIYVEPQDIKTRIVDVFGQKNVCELLEEEKELVAAQTSTVVSTTVKGFLVRARERVEAAIDKIEETEDASSPAQRKPQFPFKEGPRDYQKQAFDNWKKTQRGLFAMATGTGKTMTALNCLLEIYKQCGYYRAVILVPTQTLVEQWNEECKKFNFSHICNIFSQNQSWKQELDSLILKETLNSSGTPQSFIIISTYASFARQNVFHRLNGLAKKTLLVADEAHNMGASRILDLLGNIRFKRVIGLSATPDRPFDETGNNKLNEYFGITERYTFEYSMKDAIENGHLCRYYYYPHLVHLNQTEMTEYIGISNQLKVFFVSDDDKAPFPEKNEIVKMLLIKRKRILQKAANKTEIFRSVLEERLREKGNLRYTLVYVPEGNRPDYEADLYDTKETLDTDEETERLIDRYTKIVQEVSKTTTVRKFTANSRERKELLSGFASGDIEVLTSMKCLDEGVDVPRSEMAIFCASTGNPRQFIQRRGRILRKHGDKYHAVIHDLIVAPVIDPTTELYAMERKMLTGELKRVHDFALLSENADAALKELDETLTYYNLSIL